MFSLYLCIENVVYVNALQIVSSTLCLFEWLDVRQVHEFEIKNKIK